MSLKKTTVKMRMLRCLCLFFILYPCLVMAQSQTLPGSADPARLNDRLLQPTPYKPEEIIAQDNLFIEDGIPQPVDGFTLNSVELRGMNAFPQGYFDALIGEYTGRKVDLRVLNHLASRITQTYRDEGYFISRALVPQQEVKDGSVVIEILEGRVEDVIIDDPENIIRNDSFNILLKTVLKIKALSPLHGPTLERYILLLNESQDVAIQSILQAPKNTTTIGAVNIILKVFKKDPRMTVNYNNFGSRYVGPHQVSGVWSNGNIFSNFDNLTIQGATTLPMDEVQLGALTYSMPLNEEGLKTSFMFSYSNSEPGLSLKDLDVEGDSVRAEINLTYPFIRSRKENFNAGVSFFLSNSATEFLDQELIDDKIRGLSVFSQYELQDRWQGYNAITTTLTKGVNILGATKTGSSNLSRQQGRSDFFKIDLDATRQQDISKNYKMITSLAGQYAPHPLLSSQEFGFGGTSFGRAYDPSVITGDQGVSANIELRYDGLDNFIHPNFKVIPFTFYDIGKVWNEDRGAEPQSAVSAGFGAYYSMNNNISGSLQAAFPLTRSVDEPIMNGKNGPRILFDIAAKF